MKRITLLSFLTLLSLIMLSLPAMAEEPITSYQYHERCKIDGWVLDLNFPDNYQTSLKIYAYLVGVDKSQQASRISFGELVLKMRSMKGSDINKPSGSGSNGQTGNAGPPYSPTGASMGRAPKIDYPEEGTVQEEKGEIVDVESNDFSSAVQIDPDKVYNLELKLIGQKAFEGLSDIVEIEIPNTVTTIWANAFLDCTNLTKITIPNSVISISWGAFSGCTKLTTITLPNALKSLASGTFKDCKSLESLTIPNSVTSISWGAFENCTKLKTIKLPNALKSLESWTFRNCESLESLTIPNSVSSIKYNALDGCTKLSNLVLPSSLEEIEPWAFYKCSALKSVTIPYGIKKIYKGAFYGCGLESISLPSSLDKIDTLCFAGCAKLTSATIPAFIKEVAIGAFYDCPELETVKFDKDSPVKTIPEGAFAHCYKLKNLTLPNSLQTIGFAAFSNCCSLQTISFPGSLTTISEEAFAACDGLKSMTLPNSLRTIGESAFYACESLKTLTLPEGLTKVGESAFEGCEALTTITLPSTLRSIGYNAFAFSGSAMKVHSSIKSPFAIDAFDYDEDAILYVPVGTKSKYENTDGWGDIFGTIIEEGGSASDAVTITANSYSRVYGEANPTFGYTVTSGTITSGTPTITCSATATSPVGTYDIVISKGSVSNGTVNLVNGKLTITKAPLTISAGNYTKKQGEDNPTFTPSFSGFKNGETKSVLTKQPTITTTATKNSPVGTYPVTVSGAEAQNYSFTYVNGTLTITANSTPSDNITFADAEVKRLCIAKWDTNGDGELSKTEAAAVTNLGTVFKNNKTIKSFNELQYFTGLKAIGEQAFYGCSGLTSVTIPNSVTSIGGYAFSGCSGLTSLTIPNSVTSIGVRTFESCSGLTSIVVNSGNTVYDSRGGCNAIIQTSSNELIAGCKNTVIPNSVTSIGWFAFYGCSGLTSVTIPNSVTKIGTCAFKNCSSLTSVIIPNSVTSIGSDAFFNCKSIQEVKSYITVPFSINDNVFQYSDNGSTMFTSATLYVPKGTKAKYQTTDGWKNFTNIVELEGGPSDDNITFADANVKALCVANWDTNGDGQLSKAEAAAVTDLGTVFKNNKTIKSFNELQYFTGLKAIGDDAFTYCSGLTSVTIPTSVTSIGDFAFAWCSGLTSVTIPNSVTSIGEEAFEHCSGLTSVSIPNSVKTIGKWAFSYCSDLTTVAIPNSVTCIGPGVFSGCSSLTSVTIPNSVISIGQWAFKDCSGLTSVSIPNSVTSIGQWAFKDCSGLTSVSIPNSVTSIGDYAFYGCKGLVSVIIGNSVTSIGEGVFLGCSGLTSLAIPNSVTSIGNSAFLSCSGLTSVTIGNNVKSIEDWAFSGCSGLTSVTIPNSVTSIGRSAFIDCSGLTSVTIPNSVTSIGNAAFYGCESLQEVKSYITVPFTINDDVFQYSDNSSVKFTTATLYIPKGTKTKYQTTDGWKNFTQIVELEGLSIDGINRDDMDDDGYYTLNGRKVDGRPTTKGIYITNGRKVLIP